MPHAAKLVKGIEGVAQRHLMSPSVYELALNPDAKPFVMRTVGDMKKVVKQLTKVIPKGSTERYLVLPKKTFRKIKKILK